MMYRYRIVSRETGFMRQERAQVPVVELSWIRQHRYYLVLAQSLDLEFVCPASERFVLALIVKFS